MEPDLIQDSKEVNGYDDYDFGSNFKRLKRTENVRELQTVLRDKIAADTLIYGTPSANRVDPDETAPTGAVSSGSSLFANTSNHVTMRATNRSDFVFYADRLIRLVVEEGLNMLPYKTCSITTPTGDNYNGLVYEKGNCGVSIMRSGEAMEQGLRDCCRSIRIGKILIHSDEDTHDAKVVYSKFPPDISCRKVLLMYPIMSTGNTVIQAVNVLKENKVLEKNIILLNLFITPQAAKTMITKFPELRILTSEVHPVAPNHFGQKYFGTA